MAICTCGSDLVMAGQHESDCAVIASAQFIPAPMCKRCGKPCQSWQVFCGAGCSARWEAGDRVVAKEAPPLRPRTETEE